MIKLLTKKDCDRCEWVKNNIPEGVKVQEIDIGTADAMMYLAYFELLGGKHVPTPVLITENDEEAITSTILMRKHMRGLVGNGVKQQALNTTKTINEQCG